MVRLNFSIELDYTVSQSTEFEFMLHAAHTPQQHVIRENLVTMPPVPTQVETSEFLYNRHLRLHAEPGALVLRYSATVDIDHYLAPPGELMEVPIRDLPVDVMHYLRPSRYCPSEQFFNLATQEFGAMPAGYARVQAIADWVRNRTTFQAGTSNTSHTAIDTLHSRMGVCRDFAHLMITLCRALNIPARYATSIDYGADPALGPMDFHAYVEVYLSGRWFIFDPTGMTIPMGLVRLANGRDANDVPFATIFGRVLWSIPKITILALEDAHPGSVLPEATDLAISTSGPVVSESVGMRQSNAR
jgi:transglutaminase-like putative cysteine protease